VEKRGGKGKEGEGEGEEGEGKGGEDGERGKGREGKRRQRIEGEDPWICSPPEKFPSYATVCMAPYVSDIGLCI